MPGHPYRHLPARAFWRRTVAGVAVPDLDPVTAAPFRIGPGDRVVTAGSCFAQHIARHLHEAGFRHLVTESLHPLIAADHAGPYGYGTFSARYGNIYTARQLLQLIRRAYGDFTPQDGAWRTGDGRWVDPFRPQIQPNGFLTLKELEADRLHHLSCVRTALEDLDIFVFTLGLTEFWSSRADGAVYPLCPGVAGGEYDEALHVFHNATVAEVVDDLSEALRLLRTVNPRVRTILTVSPVPLMATAGGQHVLTATTYSKSGLRVAAEEVGGRAPDVAYFPSFEIITGNFNRGAYFADDLRSITEEGVSHVMRMFIRHYTEGAPDGPVPVAGDADAHTERMKELVRVVCDEEALDPT